MKDDKRILAVFIDFENLALGFKRSDKFDIGRVFARLVEKGDIVVKRAYADWTRFGHYSSELHENAIELIEIPRRQMTGKNSADMRLCVDCMDLCFSKPHISSFVILSGDSDFSPLVSKLKENGKFVIGLGMQSSTSDLLRDNCHEYIYYEDLEAEAQEAPAVPETADDKQKKLWGLLLESLQALRRENREILWSSLIKETMKRKRPSFNEAYYGYKSFGRLLEDAAKRGLIDLSRDNANRTYVVTRFGAEMEGPAPPPRRKRRRRRRPSEGPEGAPAELERRERTHDVPDWLEPADLDDV